MAPLTKDPNSLGELIVYGARPATTWGATTSGGRVAEFVADSRGGAVRADAGPASGDGVHGLGGNWIQIGGPAAHLYAGGPFLFAAAPENSAILRWDDRLWTQVGGAGGQPAGRDRLDDDRRPGQRDLRRGGTFVALGPAGTNLYHFDPALGAWDFVGSNLTPVVRAGAVLGVDRATSNVYRYWRP